MTAQMKKGALELCILYIASRNELYGYEIMKRLTKVFPDTGESSVYTILRRLLSDGYLICYSRGKSNGGQSDECQSNGPPRKYYRVTDSGSAYLAQSITGWKSVVDGVSAIISDEV